MIKKWAKLFLVIMVLTSSLVGCDKKEYTKEEAYSEFQEKITKINSYECSAKIEVNGNKSKQEYEVIHKYQSPEYYRLEIVSPEHLKGKVMEYKDNKVIIQNPDIKDKMELENPGKNNQYLFVGDFIRNYTQTEEVEVAIIEDRLVLELIIPGGSEYFNKQILYVNLDDMHPEKMEILDKQGMAKFTVEYDNFKYEK